MKKLEGTTSYLPVFSSFFLSFQNILLVLVSNVDVAQILYENVRQIRNCEGPQACVSDASYCWTVVVICINLKLLKMKSSAVSIIIGILFLIHQEF